MIDSFLHHTQTKGIDCENKIPCCHVDILSHPVQATCSCIQVFPWQWRWRGGGSRGTVTQVCIVLATCFPFTLRLEKLPL